MEIRNENFEKGKESTIRTEKYKKYAKILTQVETNLLYKKEIIKDNLKLENQREDDITQLLKIISDELKNDGITKIMVNGRILRIIED